MGLLLAMIKTLLFVLTLVCSVPALPGFGMIAGAFPPADEKAQVLSFWEKEFSSAGVPFDSFEMSNFFLFVGVCKVSGVLAIHGFLGRSLELVGNMLYIALCLCAYKQHVGLKVADDGIPPLIFSGLFTIRLLLSIAVGGSSDGKVKAN